jgi:hypothetical protein
MLMRVCSVNTRLPLASEFGPTHVIDSVFRIPLIARPISFPLLLFYFTLLLYYPVHILLSTRCASIYSYTEACISVETITSRNIAIQ